MFQHIVVGVDFTEQAEAALQLAAQLAVKRQARLSVLHVIDDQLARYWDALPLSPTDIEEKLLSETKQKIETQLQQAAALSSVSYEAHVFFGRPVQTLAEYCDKEHADLLVTGQRGAGILEKLLLGSTAERLLRQAELPLLTVHPSTKAPLRTVVAAVDCTAHATAALSAAIKLCHTENIELAILYVCEDFLDGMEPDEAQKEQAKQALLEYLDQPALQALQQIRYQTHVAFGVPYGELLSFTKEIGADVLVMGHAGRTGMMGFLLGNTAETIASDLSCSLLTVKSDAKVSVIQSLGQVAQPKGST